MRMPLTNLEREVITDSMLKIQSVQSSLEQLQDSTIPDLEEIDKCLRSANLSFSAALRSPSGSNKQARG